MTANGHKHAAPEDIEEWVYKNKADYVECRVKGHNMGYPNSTENDNGTCSTTEKCRRCHTKRVELTDAEGYVLHVKYEGHPDGYLLPKGTGRVSRDGMAILRKARVLNNMLKKAGRR